MLSTALIVSQRKWRCLKGAVLGVLSSEKKSKNQTTPAYPIFEFFWTHENNTKNTKKKKNSKKKKLIRVGA